MVACRTMLLYHGMVVDRRVAGWDLSKVGQGNDAEGPGVYLTDNLELARHYGKYIHYLRVNITDYITNDLRANSRMVRSLICKAPDYKDKLADWHESLGIALVNAVSSTMKYHPDLWDSLTQVWIDFYRGSEAAWIKEVVKLGIAGYLVPREKNNGALHVVCLDPETIEILDVEVASHE